MTSTARCCGPRRQGRMPGAAGDIIWAVSQAGISDADECDSRDASRDRRDFRQGGAVEHHSSGEGLSWTASRECARYPIHNRRCAAFGVSPCAAPGHGLGA